MNPQYERQLKKGVLEMLVLNMLSREKMYGYQLIQTLKKESNDFFTLKEGTLYPILYRLEDNGLAISTWMPPEKGRAPKKYYEITEKGRQELYEQLLLWNEFSDRVFDIITDKNQGK